MSCCACAPPPQGRTSRRDMSWVFRIAIACAFVWLFYRMPHWAGRPATECPKCSRVVQRYGRCCTHGPDDDGLGLHVSWEPCARWNRCRPPCGLGVVPHVGRGLLASFAAAFGFRYAPLGVFSPLLWGSLILFGMLMIARLPRRRRPSVPALLPPQEH